LRRGFADPTGPPPPDFLEALLSLYILFHTNDATLP